MRFSIAFFLALFCSCSKRVETVEYLVVDHERKQVHETYSRDEASRVADELNATGRVLPSRPAYFVVERKR